MGFGGDKGDNHRGERGVRVSHVVWVVAVKLLHKFPLGSPTSWRTYQVSGGATSSVSLVGGSLLLGISASSKGSTQSGGAYGSRVRITSDLMGMTIGGRNCR